MRRILGLLDQELRAGLLLSWARLLHFDRLSLRILTTIINDSLVGLAPYSQSFAFSYKAVKNHISTAITFIYSLIFKILSHYFIDIKVIFSYVFPFRLVHQLDSFTWDCRLYERL